MQHLATRSSVLLFLSWVYGTLWRQSDRPIPTYISHTHTLYHSIFRLWHCSSRRAVTQAGAAALVRDLECRGNCQAGRGGRCETDSDGRFIWASVLEQHVDTLLTPSAAGQNQRRLPLSVPISNVTAILMEKTKRIRLCNYLIINILKMFSSYVC